MVAGAKKGADGDQKEIANQVSATGRCKSGKSGGIAGEYRYSHGTQKQIEQDRDTCLRGCKHTGGEINRKGASGQSNRADGNGNADGCQYAKNGGHQSDFCQRMGMKHACHLQLFWLSIRQEKTICQQIYKKRFTICKRKRKEKISCEICVIMDEIIFGKFMLRRSPSLGISFCKETEGIWKRNTKAEENNRLLQSR